MRYAISNWIYAQEPLRDTFARLARFGYDGIEPVPPGSNPLLTTRMPKNLPLRDQYAQESISYPRKIEQELSNPA